MSDGKETVPGDESLKVLPGTTLDDLTAPLPPPPPFGTGKLIHPSLGEVDPADFVMPAEEPLPPGAVRGTPTPASELPPFQLPKDEDDPAGSVPAHHTEPDVSEDLRQKIGEHVKQEMEHWKERRVDDAKKYLEDARTIAPDVAKTVKSLFNSFITEGFSAEQAMALTQSVLEKKLQPFL